MKDQSKKEKIVLVITIILVILFSISFAIEEKSEHAYFSVILFVPTVFFIGYSYNLFLTHSNKRKINPNLENFYNSTNDYNEQVKKYFPELTGEEELLDILYNRFTSIEEALSNGNIDFIKNNCIDSLYENLQSQYNDYSSRNEKHILKKYKLYAYNIQNITLENHTISIEMTLHVSFYDYVINSKGLVIHGKDHAPRHEQYVLEFIIDESKNIVCPNCGAIISTKECEYCHTVLKDAYYSFTLGKIGLVENRERI